MLLEKIWTMQYRIRKNCLHTNKAKYLRTTADHNLNKYSQFEYSPIVDKRQHNYHWKDTEKEFIIGLDSTWSSLILSISQMFKKDMLQRKTKMEKSDGKVVILKKSLKMKK